MWSPPCCDGMLDGWLWFRFMGWVMQNGSRTFGWDLELSAWRWVVSIRAALIFLHHCHRAQAMDEQSRRLEELRGTVMDEVAALTSRCQVWNAAVVSDGWQVSLPAAMLRFFVQATLSVWAVCCDAFGH